MQLAARASPRARASAGSSMPARMEVVATESVRPACAVGSGIGPMGEKFSYSHPSALRHRDGDGPEKLLAQQRLAREPALVHPPELVERDREFEALVPFARRSSRLATARSVRNCATASPLPKQRPTSVYEMLV